MRFLLVPLLLVMGTAVYGQDRSADVASIDAILAATYASISGAAGEQRDWDRFRNLFAPEATLSAVVEIEPGKFARRVMTPESYVRDIGPDLTRTGFYENEIHRVTEQFGQIAHAFSSYESRRTLQDDAPFARGINSFQLLHDGERWFVVSIYWQAEGENRPIPTKYDGQQ
ncbi:MAG: hypothetical protein RL120_14180 [Gammaproteobacteria bacterium]